MWIVFRCIWALGLSKVLRDSLSRPGCVEQQRQCVWHVHLLNSSSCHSIVSTAESLLFNSIVNSVARVP